MSDIVERTYRIKVRGDISSLDDIEARVTDILDESEDENGTKHSFRTVNEVPIEEEEEDGEEEDSDEEDEEEGSDD